MKITPLDIQQQQFTVRFRGFDIQEVDSFLETVANELEEQIKKNTELREELERKEARIWEYQNMEKTLKETLMVAQATSEEMKRNSQKAAEDLRASAQREASLIISRAREQADKIIGETNANLAKTEAAISDLGRKKILLEQELRSVLETHLKLLEPSSKKPASPSGEKAASDS
jgi:cell division initiation protein